MVSQTWFASSERIAQRVDNRRPKTVGDLYPCFDPSISYCDYTMEDFDAF